ncbi:Flp pilus assembly complex ATPase component TadA [Paenibacillus sp. N4]|uniref:ATPase, T2SS/T4P/T4SS family n=1 Tax=Paenibacillus vietnamensis TaxID=2590547 RepID=UPI001CD15A68|nr:ATPase, T2SS/T4P/T4SS family [Paenibacillus vietnamensis]MCA0756771.1 Flp pilus assembly complex ATPase component TadA [Paenibacillus vietnamensis]
MTLLESRFSPSEYAVRMKKSDQALGGGVAAGQPAEAAGEEFARLADDIRSYLSAPHGLGEEERRQYGETLNRAVLGYAKEREQVLAVITDRLIRLRIHGAASGQHPYQTLAEALFAEVIGLNVLELVLADKDGLEEIQVVGEQIFIVKDGVTALSEYRFGSVREVERIQQNLVLYNNDRINPRKRWAEVMLRDGSRVTMTGFGFTSCPTLTIRFYTVRSFKLETLCSDAYRTINPRLQPLLKRILAARFNIVIIGPTNSGKTNLMKAFIAELPDEERIITIESRFEMMLGRDFPRKNVVEYETEEDDPQHRSDQAFKLALRQSPQRIIHAEIRDVDANIYVRACTRGHSGSMTTVHANRLEDVPEAITDMCMLDGRGMNAERLTKRITQYVTEVGLEMRYLNGRRVLSRIGELLWEEGQAVVRDWALFDEGLDDWVFPSSPSAAAAARLIKAGEADE